MTKPKTDLTASRFALKKETVKDMRVASGIKTGLGCIPLISWIMGCEHGHSCMPSK